MTKQQQQTKAAPVDPIADAQAAIARLEAQREELAKRRAEHEVERSRIAFRARAQGDAEASKRLSEMAAEAVRDDGEARDIEAALTTAQARLQEAEAAQVAAVNRQRAEEVRKIVAEMAEVPAYIDKHLLATLKGLLAIESGFKQLRQLGVMHPNDTHVRLDVCNCFNSWAMQLPRLWYSELSDGLRYPPPHARKSFAEYWRAIEPSLLNQRPGESPPAQMPAASDRREAAAAAAQFLGRGA
jgi:hypothetical protein